MDKGLLVKVLWAGMGAVLVTLVLGLFTMIRSKDTFLSNRLMQIRVALQLVSLLIFGYLLWKSHG